MRIAIYAIAKDEAANAERFMVSASEADLVVVTDTGSADGTPDLLRQLGSTVHETRIDPWRFDEARNIALANVPEDVDICVSMDLDETLQPGWRDALEELWQDGVTQIAPRWVFSWEDEAQTVPGVTAYPPRMHARHGYRWKGAVHELPLPLDSTKHKAIITDSITGYHWRQQEKSYIDLLTVLIEQTPDNPTLRLQRAGDLLNEGRHEEALQDYAAFLELTRNGEHERQRAFAEIAIAKCLHKLGEPGAVLVTLLRAVAEDPNCREAWTYLADAWQTLGNWPAAYGAAMTALRITDSGGQAREEVCWSDYPKQIASSAYSRITQRGSE